MKTIAHLTGAVISTFLMLALIFALLAWLSVLPSVGLLWLAGAL